VKTTAEILELLGDKALLLEPREVYDDCLVGVTAEPKDNWPRKGGVTVAVYDAEKCIEAIRTKLIDGGSYEAAADWFGFNTSGGWNGEGTPTFVWPDDDDYLAKVVECDACGERYCSRCDMHWADCPCPGPHDA